MTKTTNHTTLDIRLGMDLDGVIYNFVDEFRNYLIDHQGRDPEELIPATQWNFFYDWGMTLEEYEFYLTQAAIDGYVFKSGEVYAGAVEALLEVEKMGFEIVVITARRLTDVLAHHEIIEQNTYNWLTDNNIPHHGLIISNEKTTHDLNILVDDSVKNVENFILAGGRGYIFDRPWNQDYPYNRIDNWECFVEEMRSIRDMVNAAYLNDLQASNA